MLMGFVESSTHSKLSGDGAGGRSAQKTVNGRSTQPRILPKMHAANFESQRAQSLFIRKVGR